MSAANSRSSRVGQTTAEQIVLPGSSFLPLTCALGLMIIFIGLANWWVILAVGAAIFVVTTVRWLAQIS